MTSCRSILLATTVLALAPLCGSAMAADASIAAAVASPARPQWDGYRDANLKPAEIMAYAGAKPGMIAADMLPEGGYWTRILSGIAGAQGEVYMMVPSNGADRGGPKIKDPSQNFPMTRVELAYGVDDQPEFPNVSVYWQGLGPAFSVPKQLDLVLNAGDYHVLKSDEFAKVNLGAVHKGIYNALKNGGVYLVIDNAANKGAGFTAAKTLNRIDADAVKAEILPAGFQLDGESTILARPGDDHSKLADGDGADMFVLRFRKPLDAPNTDKRPADPKAALAGYFGNTRRSNPGLIGKDDGPRERRVMYHEDMTYQEYGQLGTGDNPWQSGTLYYNADGNGCMLHLFPSNQRGQVACSSGRAAPSKKLGDFWTEGGLYEMIGPGYVPFPNTPAREGATLGNTPQEIARAFGRNYRFAADNGTDNDWLDYYLKAYRNFRGEAEGDPAALNAEFEKGLGRKMPGL